MVEHGTTRTVRMTYLDESIEYRYFSVLFLFWCNENQKAYGIFILEHDFNDEDFS